MRVWEGGVGPPILAVHGLGASGRLLAGALRPCRRTMTALHPGGEGMDFRSRPDLRPSIPRRMLSRGVRSIWPAIAVPVGVARGYPHRIVIDFGRRSVRSRPWTMWSLLSAPELPPPSATPCAYRATGRRCSSSRTMTAPPRRASGQRWRAQLPAAGSNTSAPAVTSSCCDRVRAGGRMARRTSS
jgi:hypothetical protein